ncbi:tRNA (adenosine(37)-N6)-threonylcarbamoyltransferase complex dimerization subunit type 1 TsaB [Edaphobacillus lindanitolerans]|uniref:tRNA threonylcarbamoyladenosine biosynthesis protein TsaB n=1 Tax=Edaphobacillus lindanitolerans TaxID=550447 RepID=A0A1U7PQB5_9BACI|nr:tRNA (adenosine(37)-N6)-threonylcarbamoyltransferase complex dimerization subunit type 1 TsaB [Edaphobacillus lindanitolerans]SIT92533.1 tRNA threonylcarbamoyladenosine biosynthesis protein TsaB [Edaphobacillus lindanitolerans]
MIWLGLDTSNLPLSAALVRDGELLVELNSAVGLNHSEGAMPAVDELFGRAGLAPSDIDAIAVAEGPGSYTGVRIGVTIAKTLAWTLDKPLTGVSSLRVLAANVLSPDVTICPLIDARRGNVFAGLYKRTRQGTIEVVEEDRHQAFSDLLDRLGEGEGPVVFLGPGASVHWETAGEALGHRAVRAHAGQDIPRASLLIDEAQNLPPVGDLHSFTPEYRRIPEAVSNWRKSQEGNVPDGR